MFYLCYGPAPFDDARDPVTDCFASCESGSNRNVEQDCWRRTADLSSYVLNLRSGNLMMINPQRNSTHHPSITSHSTLKMSSVLPHDPSPANNQTAPLTETQHDLEFRTITTLLHILGIGERIDLDDFRVSMPQRAHLKLLSALSSLLVRHTEIIAVMPKRSVFGTTLFVCAGVEYTTGQYFPHDESITSRDDSVTRNREIDDPVGPVKLLDSPTVEIGSDIFAFMLQNWFVIPPIPNLLRSHHFPDL